MEVCYIFVLREATRSTTSGTEMSFVPLSSKDQLAQTFLFALRLHALGGGTRIIAYTRNDLEVTGPGRVILDATWDTATDRLHIKVGAGEFVFDGGLWNLGETEKGRTWVLLKNTTFVNQFSGDPECLKFVFKISR